MEVKLVFWSLLGLFGLFIIGTLLVKPLRFLLRLGFHLAVGVVLLVILNLVLGQIGFNVAINPATILTAGFLQIPGVFLLVVLNYIFV